MFYSIERPQRQPSQAISNRNSLTPYFTHHAMTKRSFGRLWHATKPPYHPAPASSVTAPQARRRLLEAKLDRSLLGL